MIRSVSAPSRGTTTMPKSPTITSICCKTKRTLFTIQEWAAGWEQLAYSFPNLGQLPFDKLSYIWISLQSNLNFPPPPLLQGIWHVHNCTCTILSTGWAFAPPPQGTLGTLDLWGEVIDLKRVPTFQILWKKSYSSYADTDTNIFAMSIHSHKAGRDWRTPSPTLVPSASNSQHKQKQRNTRKAFKKLEQKTSHGSHQVSTQVVFLTSILLASRNAGGCHREGLHFMQNFRRDPVEY